MPRSRSRSPRQHHHHSRHGKYGRRAGRRTHDREGGRRYNERLARGFGFGGFGYGGYGAIQGGAIGGYGGYGRPSFAGASFGGYPGAYAAPASRVVSQAQPAQASTQAAPAQN
eukprot:TRINITY_DN606_c0_g1_i1.p2 TRINITY_DN606_c0_g1~~TRINITY_DN606_c0_g1_i1.p2  ORF type:complete len:113 (+),score=19.79 TRINITY_DN606_c0_g1_i1:260-598(+)